MEGINFGKMYLEPGRITPGYRIRNDSFFDGVAFK